MKCNSSTLRALGVCLVAVGLVFAGSLDASAQLSPYSQDFETLSMGDGSALSNDGWLISGLVFDGGGGFKFFYGNFPAPNGGPSFSAVATGEAGPPQGVQYLNTYSDYNCCDLGTPTPQGHGNGTDIVENNIFQEQIIGAGSIGQTFTFSFDGKLPADPGVAAAAPSEVRAFIRTLDPNAGFATTNFITLDALTLDPNVWKTRQISLSLADPALEGQFLQFGVNSRSSNFGPTGFYLDNINVTIPEPGSLALAGMGLLAMIGVGGRRKRS